ncbi:MAG: c-type cytochrome [Betaproteobacteria bacterium]
MKPFVYFPLARTLCKCIIAALLAFPLTIAFSADEIRNPFVGDPEAAAEGKKLFLKNGCYACHGHEAEGAVGPDLTDDEWIYKPTDAMIFNTIRRGRSGTVMAPFGDQIKPDGIWKIVEFLRAKNRERKAAETK